MGGFVLSALGGTALLIVCATLLVLFTLVEWTASRSSLNAGV
jgi:hypothetical protein